MPRKPKPEFGPNVSEELDIPTRIEITTKKHDQKHYGRMACPGCIMADISGNKPIWVTSMVRIPERLLPGASYACTVCSQILHVECLAKANLPKYT